MSTPGGLGPSDASDPPGPLERRTRVAAYAVCRDGDAVLLCRLSSDRRRWTLPGGGLDFGEDPRDAAVREAREETGLDVVLDALLGVDSLRMPHLVAPDESAPLDLHAVRVVYAAHAVGGELRHELAGTTDRAAWVPLADLVTDDPARRLPRVELVDTALAWLGLADRKSVV